MTTKQTTLPEKMMVCLRKYANQGKSGAIKALAELLMPDPPKAKAEWRVPKDMPISEWPDDICVAVDVNGRRIGLCSDGDDPDDIKENLEFLLKKEKCGIIFCTSRERGPTVGAIEEVAQKYGHTIIWTAPYTDNTPPQKKPTPLQEKLNRIKAEQLKDFLKG